MEKSILKLEGNIDNESAFRTIFKTRHGRVVFLSV